MRRCFPWLLILILSGSMGLVPGPLWAQQEEPATVPFDGSQFFRNLLHIHNLKPVQDISQLKDLPPEQTIIIIFGDPLGLQCVWDELQLDNYYREGGALLIAMDRNDQDLLRRFGLKVTGKSVFQYPQLAYRSKSTCPLITNYDNNHPLFRGVKQGIATNRPCWVFRNIPSEFDVGARFTRPVLISKGFQWEGSGLEEVFLVHSDNNFRPDSRMVVMGGHGVFLNGMVAMEDNDNWIFALNCVKWLADNDQRRYVLFIEEGIVQTQFDVGLTEMPPLPFPDEAMLNGLLRGSENIMFALEKSNAFERMMWHYFTPTHFLRYLVVGFSLFLLVRGLRGFFLSRYRRERALPLVSRTLEKTTSDKPLLEQRQQTTLQSKNLRETAQMLARCWFTDHFPSEPVTHPPQVRKTDKGQPRRWQKQINRLWHLAYGDVTSSVSPRQIRKLYALLMTLHQRWKEGSLQFGEPRVEG